RAGCAAAGTLDARALGPDGRKVVAYAAAAAHGLGSLRQRGVYAWLAVLFLGDRISYRLHEAVDQRAVQLGTGCAVDAAGGDEAMLHGPEKFVSERGAPVRRLGLG